LGAEECYNYSTSKQQCRASFQEGTPRVANGGGDSSSRGGGVRHCGGQLFHSPKVIGDLVNNL
jgi:hypothetical protein